MIETMQDAHNEAEAITPYSMHVCITNKFVPFTIFYSHIIGIFTLFRTNKEEA
jgi:hypothetical protein